MTEKSKNQPIPADPATGKPKPMPKAGDGDGVVEDDRLTEWFMDVFIPQYGKQAGIVVAVLAAALALWFGWSGIQNKSETTANRKLGKAYVFLAQEKLDSAASALVDIIKEGPGGLAEAKARLLLGKTQYAQGRYDEAIQSYQAVSAHASKHALVASGALHGLAACYMEKKDYGKAIEHLEKFVSEFGHRTGDPEERLAGKEVVDPTPVMPNVLWKLTLCYREIKDMAKAKATAEKLTRIYPESREANDALRLLAQL